MTQNSLTGNDAARIAKAAETVKAAHPDAIVMTNISIVRSAVNNKTAIIGPPKTDLLVLTKEGVIVIGIEYISNKIYASVSGSAALKNWKLVEKHGGEKVSRYNGVKRTQQRMDILREVLASRNIDAPIYQITAIAGLPESKIFAQQYRDTNLIHISELADKVTYLRERSSKKDVNTTAVEEVIEEYCRPEGL